MGRAIRGQTLALAELVRKEKLRPPVFEGYTFERCILQGPAIVWPVDSTFRGLTVNVDGDVESVIWEWKATGTPKIGVIALRACTFEQCTFEQIGFLFTEAAFASRFRAQIGPPK